MPTNSFYLGFVTELAKLAERIRSEARPDPTAPFGYRFMRIEQRPLAKRVKDTVKGAASAVGGEMLEHGMNPLPVVKAVVGGVDDPETATSLWGSVKGIPGAVSGVYRRLKDWVAKRKAHAAEVAAFKKLPGINRPGVTYAPAGPPTRRRHSFVLPQGRKVSPEPQEQ